MKLTIDICMPSNLTGWDLGHFNTPLRLLESNTQVASLVIPNLMGGKSTTVAFFHMT